MLIRTALRILAISVLSGFLATTTLAASDGCGLQGKVPTDRRIKNTVKWATASESNVFAYDVFRGESENGDFSKLTKDPILGAGTTDVTQHYQFVDDTIDPCKEYWYYVEEVTTQGNRSKATPVFKAKAKRQPGNKAVDSKSVEKKK